MEEDIPTGLFDETIAATLTTEQILEEISTIKERGYVPLVYIVPVSPSLASDKLYEMGRTAIEQALKGY